MSLSQFTSYHFAFSITIQSSFNQVWDYLIVVNKWPEWDTEIIEAHLDDSFKLDATGSLRSKTGPTLKFHISEIASMKSYTFRTKMPIGYLDIKRSIVQTDKGVVFTDDIKFTGVLRAVFRILLGRGFRAVLPEVMSNFRESLNSRHNNFWK